MLNGKRSCFYVNESMVNEKGEFLPVIVVEDQPGFIESGRICSEGFQIAYEGVEILNMKLGLSVDEVDEIVLSSVKASVLTH